MRGALILSLVLLAGAGAAPGPPEPPPAYELRARHDPNGIGKFYLGREIARTTGPETAAWQERATREREQRPDLLVRNLGLAPDDVVADIGAGTGYHTFRISPLVPRGKVIAVEIDPAWIRLIQARARARKDSNVETVLGNEKSPRLAPGSVDLVLMVDVYHELAYPVEMMAEIRRALAPGGRVVIVEYRAEDPEVRVMQIHKMTEAQVRREIGAAGLLWRETRSVLPQQHMVFFERPRPGGGEGAAPAPAVPRDRSGGDPAPGPAPLSPSGGPS